jgi:hypothetical protein
MDVFIMSHGSNVDISDNNEDLAITLNDNHYFRKRKAFVFACNTGNNLGKNLSLNNGSYFGYNKTINSPYASGIYVTYFAEIFDFILNGFQKVSTLEEGKSFILSLKEKINEIEMRLAKLEKFQSVKAPQEVYVSLRHVWSRLVLWNNGTILDPFNRESKNFLGFD